MAWILCAMSAFMACAGEQRSMVGPNVVLISADTLRYDRLNAYGYRQRRTSPNVDRLAADGILFEVALTASPWTTPAHMSLFTGLGPSAHGMVTPLSDLQGQRQRNQVQRLPDGRTTLAEVLRAQGYRTAAFTGGGTMDPRIGFDRGFSFYETSMFKMSEASMAQMLSWIRQHRGQRFFVFWHTFETHFPYLGGAFLPDVMPETGVQAAKPVIEQLARQLAAEGLSDPSAQRAVAALQAVGLLTRDGCEALYAGSVRSLDRWLGVLLDALHAEGLYDEALIVFTSDHGEEFGDHHASIFYNGHGHSMFEEVVRIPLIIKLPHAAHRGRRVPASVRLIDVYPTVLEVLGLPSPEEPIEGRSLAPFWKGTDTAGRTALIEATAFGYELKAVRTARRKYVVGADEAMVRAHGRQYVPETADIRWLYDLVHDPKETRSLLTPPVPPSVHEEAATLHGALRRLVPPSLGATDRAPLDDETLERLRALGYLDP